MRLDPAGVLAGRIWDALTSAWSVVFAPAKTAGNMGACKKQWEEEIDRIFLCYSGQPSQDQEGNYMCISQENRIAQHCVTCPHQRSAMREEVDRYLTKNIPKLVREGVWAFPVSSYVESQNAKGALWNTKGSQPTPREWQTRAGLAVLDGCGIGMLRDAKEQVEWDNPSSKKRKGKKVSRSRSDRWTSSTALGSSSSDDDFTHPDDTLDLEIEDIGQCGR